MFVCLCPVETGADTTYYDSVNEIHIEAFVTDDAIPETLQFVPASQTDEGHEGDTATEQVDTNGGSEMIYQFLSHTIDIESSNLTEKLSAKNILSPAEKQKIKEQRSICVKVKVMVSIMMREKSASEFEGFLTTLSETGQQSVADVVRQALHTVDQTERNSLLYTRGM